MTTTQILLAIGIIVLFAVMILPTIMALGAPGQQRSIRMIGAVVVFTFIWVTDALHPFPAGSYRDCLWLLAAVLAYLAAQHYMNKVFDSERSGSERMEGLGKLIQLAKSSALMLACMAITFVAAYLPAQVYLFLWDKVDGTAAGVVGVLFWVFGVHVVWIAEAGLVGIIWAGWNTIRRAMEPTGNDRLHQNTLPARPY